jgi:hypothetical protein
VTQQQWYCPTCRKGGAVEIPEGRTDRKVIEAIKEEHALRSPSCPGGDLTLNIEDSRPGR